MCALSDGRRGLDLQWSAWHSLTRDGWRRLPESRRPGLYRVRYAGTERLAYVGETGGMLRDRLSDLERGARATTMPFCDPHSAAPGLWALRQQGYEFEVALAPVAA